MADQDQISTSPALVAQRPRSLHELRREYQLRLEELYDRQAVLLLERLHDDPANERPLCVAIRAVWQETCRLSGRLRQVEAELQLRRAA